MYFDRGDHEKERVLYFNRVDHEKERESCILIEVTVRGRER